MHDLSPCRRLTDDEKNRLTTWSGTLETDLFVRVLQAKYQSNALMVAEAVLQQNMEPDDLNRLVKECAGMKEAIELISTLRNPDLVGPQLIVENAETNS